MLKGQFTNPKMHIESRLQRCLRLFWCEFTKFDIQAGHTDHVRIALSGVTSCSPFPSPIFNRRENDLWTVVSTSSRRSTTVLMSVSVEYVTDVKRINTTGDEPLFSSAFLSLPVFPHPCFHALSTVGKGKSSDHIIEGKRSRRALNAKQPC